MEKYYDIIPDMECIAGDTLPEFIIESDVSGTMQLLLARYDAPDTAILTKPCRVISGGFSVQLTSADTSGLCGAFRMTFSLTSSSGNRLRKLGSILVVRPAPAEA